MVFELFWSVNGYSLCPFWSGIGYGKLEETTGVYECDYGMNKKEREINANSKCIFSNLFCWLFNLNNNEMTS